MKKRFAKRYRISFEYSLYVYDSGHGDDLNEYSGYGLAVGIGKDYSSYRQRKSFPIGPGIGFVRDGAGYGIQLKTYGSRRAFISDGNGEKLSKVIYRRGIYTSAKNLDVPGRASDIPHGIPHGEFEENERIWVRG